MVELTGKVGEAKRAVFDRTAMALTRSRFADTRTAFGIAVSTLPGQLSAVASLTREALA